MTPAPGTRLGPYEIVELLGKGGMGEVYLARDTRLDREVAIKVLPVELGSDERYRRRLKREARTISQLQHPNVCMLLDFGTEGAVQYLVMEFLEGETLEVRLQNGALPVAEVLRIGSQLARAVESAHRKGIIHRDLKPGNVMLSKTGIKVLDFGLAREVASSDEVIDALAPTAFTEEGSLVGTMPYMAPEQLQRGEVDSRTDIWALGCILYEMTTGDRPFAGKSQADLIAAIMGSTLEPPTGKRALAPERLYWIIKRCLEKDPEDRWQSARDVALELEATLTNSAAPPKLGRLRWAAWKGWGLSAAVLLLACAAGWWVVQAREAREKADRLAALVGGPSGHAFVPFENTSGDADLHGLAVAVRENAFAVQIPGERPLVLLDSAVIADDGLCPSAKGRRWVWQGRVSRLQDRIKVAVTIIGCPEEAVRWSETYEFEHSNLIVIAEEVASRMMTESQQRTTQASGTPGSVRWYMTRRTAESNAEALALVRAALPENPNLSDDLMRLLIQALFEGYGDPSRHVDELKDLAESMRTGNPDNWIAHMAAGWAGVFGGDRELMLRGFERALELQGLPVAHQLLAAGLTFGGRPDEALEHIEEAFSLSPNDGAAVRWHQRASQAHFAAGRYVPARDAALEAVKLRVNDLFNAEADAYLSLAASYAHLNQIEEAHDALKKARELRPTLDARVALAPFAAADQDLRARYLDGLRMAGLGE